MSLMQWKLDDQICKFRLRRRYSKYSADSSNEAIFLYWALHEDVIHSILQGKSICKKSKESESEVDPPASAAVLS